MKFIVTLMTTKQTSGTPIVAGLIAAARTGLRGMSRVNRNHRTTACFCLVCQELAQLVIRPPVHPPSLFTTALFGPLTDMRQIFNGNRATFWRGLRDLFTQNVITIPSKLRLLVPDAAQVAFGAFCAALLQLAAQVEVPSFDRFPATLAKKVAVGRNSGVRQSKINADHRLVQLHIRRWHRHNDVQPPVTVTQEQIGAIRFTAEVLPRILRHGERDALPSGNRRQIDDLALPVHRVRMHVVAWRTAPRPWLIDRSFRIVRKLQSTCHRFRRFDPRLDVQVTDKIGILRLEGIVQRVVQRHAVFDAFLPAVGGDCIEYVRKLPARVQERVRLCHRRLQFDADRALHSTCTLPYIHRFCNSERRNRTAFFRWRGNCLISMEDTSTFGLSQIGQIAVPVRNLETAIAFYRDQLGMRHLFTAGTLAFFDAGGIRLMLSVPEKAEFDHPSSIIYYKVDDIEAAYAALKGRGVMFEDEPHIIANMGTYDLWMTFFRDSEQNLLGIMSEVAH